MNKNVEKVKQAWDWVWNSDSLLSWIVALLLIFVFVKFIFFPSLSLIFGTSLPLAGVESSSMDHGIVSNGNGKYTLCSKTYSREDIHYVDFDEYWEVCGDWYENRDITKEMFSGFSLKNGFSKGDIIVVWGRFEPKLGDVIIFNANEESLAPRPIIHRIVKISDGVIGTKGDHNAQQLTSSNNNYRTDETNIGYDQVVGKAIFKIPYLGWPKIWLVEALKLIFN